AAWIPGESAGTAIANVVFGRDANGDAVDPGGRLPVTFPESDADIPTAGDPEKYPGVAENVYYKEGVLVGYRWYDANGIEPAFGFGHGLSYTDFAYSGLAVTADPSGGAAVDFEVDNVGPRPGSDVAQLDGKVAVVTGAGRGLGRSHALALAAAGAAAVVNDLDLAGATVAAIAAAGGRAATDDSDVSTLAGAGAVVRRALDEFGRVDVVGHHAGV